MTFNKDSAFKEKAEQMQRFFDRWEQSALDVGKTGSIEDSHKRTQASFERSAKDHLSDAQEQIEDLATRLPMEFQHDLIQISRHVEDAQDAFSD